jgi:hypothetical protein
MYVAAAVKDRAAAAKSTATSSASTSTSAPNAVGPRLTATKSSQSYTANQPSPSIESTSLMSTSALCGGGPRSKLVQAAKPTKKTRRVSGSSWSSKPYKARKQFKAPRLSNIRKGTSPPSKTVSSTAFEDRSRRTGLGAFGSQWNSNASGNKENVDPFRYNINI